MTNMTTSRLDIRQIFAAPVLWIFIASVTALTYPVLGLPLFGICVACLYWAFRAAFFSKWYTHFLGGILLFGMGAGVAFLLIGCIMLSEQFFHLPRNRSYLVAPVGLLYFIIWFCFSLAIGGGLAVITIVGALVGKENAQAAVAAPSVVGLPILTLGYGMRVIIGLSELRKLERTTGKRFPLPELEEAQRIRAANWIGRLVNPELRAIYRAERQDRKAATGRAYSRTSK